MSSQAIDYEALASTTSIEEITEDEFDQDTLQSLKNDELSALRLCAPDSAYDNGDYELHSSEESLQLGWLGHFMKKSTRLESFGILGGGIFDSCSEQSVDRFLENLGRCNHVKKMNFLVTDLAKILYKLGPAMKSNNITHLVVEACYLGVPEATFLFNTLRDMNSLEYLCVDCEDDESDSEMLDDVIIAKCIPSLAACKGMRELKLNGMNLSTNSCTALSAIFPRMAALLGLSLCGNSIDDDCTRVLTQGLSGCTQIQSLNLKRNIISDDGLDVLIQGLPTSVATLHLGWNEITLARQLPLLRFKELRLWCNRLSTGGPRVIAASLSNPECRLESLNLTRCNIGDEGAAILAPSLRDNQRLIHMILGYNNIAECGWNAFSSILCDTSSIDATHGSNHTLQDLRADDVEIPQDIKMLLELNADQDKCRVAAIKILQVHRHLDMRPFFSMELDLLPRVVAWLDRFAESRPDHRLSSIFEFVRAMPMKVNGMLCKDMGKSKGEKRKLNNE